MNRKTCSIVLLALGILTIIVGVVIEVVPEQMMPDMLRKNLAIVPESKTFETWSDPSRLPVTMQFTFFNLKNNLETKANKESTDKPIEEGGTPVVEEMGPYVYREKRTRTNVTFNEDKTQLSFTEKTEFVFDEDSSNGLEDDLIYGLNLPLLTVYGLAPDLDDLAKGMINGIPSRFPKEITVVQRKTVKEWLWGSSYKILVELKNAIKFLPPSMLPPGMKEKLSFTDFGFMMDNNASTDYTIGTGWKNLKDLGQIKKYNGKTKLDYWGSGYANKIQGTDGSIFHPNVEADETLFMFSGDICRSIYATKEKEEEVKGVKTLVFSPPKEVFAAAHENPDNEGFCEPKPCLGPGMYRLSNCRHDAPVVLSSPHLYGADEATINSVKGIHPDPNKHKTRLFVEPNTGVMVQAHKRLGFNALFLPMPGMELTKDLNTSQIVPLFWLQEGYTGDDEFASMLKSNVNMIEFFPKNGKGIFYTLIAVGLILIIIAFIVYRPQEEKNGYDINLVPPMRMSSVAKNQDKSYVNVNNGFRH